MIYGVFRAGVCQSRPRSANNLFLLLQWRLVSRWLNRPAIFIFGLAGKSTKIRPSERASER